MKRKSLRNLSKYKEYSNIFKSISGYHKIVCLLPKMTCDTFRSESELNVHIYDVIHKKKHNISHDIGPDEKDLIISSSHHLIDSLFPDIPYDTILMNEGTILVDYLKFIDNAEYLYSRSSFRIHSLFDLLGIECSKENIIVMIRSCLFEIFGVSMRFTGQEIELRIV